MAFKFSLQAVLEQRLAIEDKRQREYGEARAKVEDARERQRQAKGEVERWIGEIRNRMDVMPFAQREMIERWIASQQDRIELLDEEIKMLAQQAEQVRLKLVKAAQDRTVMEKLRETERKAWRQEEERAERRFFDELAVRDFIDRKDPENNAGPEERIAG